MEKKPFFYQMPSVKMTAMANRLINENSPYLRQHAHNPVDWFPWGEEAFAQSLKLDRPIFLSVGYATCHWCHVMERESFEDKEIAAYLNENFISIKVDREERPDIDSIYMRVVQALNGGGGWPMSVWLKPDKQPFFAGTYFPARDGERGSRIGFLTLLKQIREVYDQRRASVDEQSSELIRFLIQSRAEENVSGFRINGEISRQVFAYYQRNYDNKHGGLRGAPKFPSSLCLPFLFRYACTEASALQMALHTSQEMARGGIYDQVGGGFHRYSTDPQWLVPHFEKMLYDNGLLAESYATAWQLTQAEEFSLVLRETLAFVEREMSFTHKSGIGFYSAFDADSLTPSGEKDEGYFFTWTIAELEEAAGKEKAKEVARYYGVTAEGNFEGRSILSVQARDGKSFPAEIKKSLYDYRLKRPQPLLDDKTLTAWNALMISGFAKAGFALNDSHYLALANKACSFLCQTMFHPSEGVLYRCYKDGHIKQPGFADDYAFLIKALLDVFEVTGDLESFKRALKLQQALDENFWDDKSGGYYLTGKNHEALIVREKPNHDGAEPCANSIAAQNLLRLHALTSDVSYWQRCEQLFASFSQSLSKYPMSLAHMACAVDFYLAKAQTAVIVYSPNNEENERFEQVLRGKFLPNWVLIKVPEQKIAEYEEYLPIVKGKKLINQKTTVYICENKTFVCKQPISSVDEFQKSLN